MGRENPTTRNTKNICTLCNRSAIRGSSHPVAQGAFHEVRTMNTTEKTNTTTTTGANERPITFSDEPNAVVIRISGAAFGNLKKIADAMNGASWTGNDHTPAWAVQFQIGSFLDRLAYAPETCGSENVTELTFDIINDIDTGFEEGTPEDKARRDELRAAFEAAGV